MKKIQLLLAAVTLTVTPAHAVPLIELFDATLPAPYDASAYYFVFDCYWGCNGGAGDLAPWTPDLIVIDHTLGIWQVQATAAVVGLENGSRLELQSVTATSSGPGSLGVRFTEGLPVYDRVGAATAQVQGTTAGTVGFAGFVGGLGDSGVDLPLGPFGPGSFGAALVLDDARSVNGIVSETLTITHPGPGVTTLSAFVQARIPDLTPTLPLLAGAFALLVLCRPATARVRRGQAGS